MNRGLLDLMEERVLVLDGAMGTSLQSHDLGPDDFEGLDGCNEVLTVSRPDIVRQVHAGFLEAGCDAVETNTFGANHVVLAEYGIAGRTFELNERAARLAREVCRDFSIPDRPRFAVGSIGPGMKLPSLGQATFEALVASYTEQARGLLRGGADALSVETCQDLLQMKAALVSCLEAMQEEARRVPLIVQVTIEQTGAMLLGSDVQAVWAVLEPYAEVDVVGLNCATGPEAMVEHLRTLAGICDRKLCCMPNAGLPEMEGGRAVYRLAPAELARYHAMFVRDFGFDIVGGCCGTTAGHMGAVVDEVWGEVPRERRPSFEPSLASLYTATSLRQDTSFLMVGERTNANGSLAFRKRLEEGDMEGMVRMAREQVAEGAHVLDLCTAYVGRDEVAEMSAVVERFARDITVPLMIDTTEPPVVRAALERIGGRAVVNSVSLEDGGRRLREVLPLVRRHGAALVCLTIDEEGMARTAQRKVEVARRIHDLVTGEYGLRPQDLLFDALTFTIASGDEEYRHAAQETIEGLRRIKEDLPGVQTLLGVSNVSFGLKPAARVVLNSVFLHHAVQAGLDAAIVHTGKILPLNRFGDGERDLAERLIRDDRSGGSDPLMEFMALFEGDEGKERFAARRRERAATVEEELKRRIIEGDRSGMEEELERALERYDPLALINQVLLEGMKQVGALFASGEMQLPFVLQSAETMKAAASFLEPRMERAEGREKGRIVLATVRGDVHDIGKNLVDIILTNNGFKTWNLGLKVPVSRVAEAVREHRADAVGLSGLLVKSTLVMREDLEELERMGFRLPVILGGAALTRRYVEKDLRQAYQGEVHYARDAFEGLALMERICSERRGGQIHEAPVPVPSGGPVAVAPSAAGPEPVDAQAEEFLPGETGLSGVASDVPVPHPPFLGHRVVEEVPLAEVWPYLNEIALFRSQWQFRQKKMSHEEYARLIEETVRPLLAEWKRRCEEEALLRPAVVYGYWRCQSEGDDLLVYEGEGERELVRFRFPRQPDRGRLCLADYFRPVGSGELDVVAFSLVTVGEEASRRARALYEGDRYQDYLYLHGLSVEAAEALAERWHQRIREELRIAQDDAACEEDVLVGRAEPAAVRKLFSREYQGARYSFGYPACPDLRDQEKIQALLPFDGVGVNLSETWQLHPEQSTSALVCHHPEAKYFTV